MILAVDLGNTSVHFGLFEGKRLLRQWRTLTSGISEYQRIRKWVSGYRDIRVMVSSVVPRANGIIRRLFPDALFVNHQNAGIKVKVKNPAEVGTDRLVNARAAYTLYKGPCIVVDFGTATTFDVVSATGEYLGGSIAPGINLARDALYEQTAKLPKIKIVAPKRVIGNDSVSAMQSGLVYGYVAMVEGMIKRMRSAIRDLPAGRHGPRSVIKVVATGGLAKLICKYTDVVDTIDAELTLKGLRLIGESLDV